MNPPVLGIVVPCYNEEEVLGETTSRLVALLASLKKRGELDERSSIFYVDDGSRDRTWALILELSELHPEVCGIQLSRNRGQQNALVCGLMTAPGDALISVDADLQDDLNAIPEMLRHYTEGCDIVYGVRKSRDTDTFFKHFTAVSYYKLMAAMKTDVLFNHADYRLLSRRALHALSQYGESNLFLRGVVRLLGFRSAVVEYDREERFAGQSKYPLRALLSLAWQGITSFSTAPLSFITVIGFVISMFSVGLGVWALGAHLLLDRVVPGWASTVIPAYFLGGVQLFCLGVIGEYVAKIYMETKARPRFHIDKLHGKVFSASCPTVKIDEGSADVLESV